MSRYFALGRGEAKWVLCCLLVVALLAADILTGGPLNHIDHAVRDQIQRRSPHTPGWMTPPDNLGEVGTATALMLGAALISAQVLWRLWPVVLAVGNLVSVEILVLVLKTAVGRPGPGSRARLDGYPGYFPSGHTATSAVCAGTVAFLAVTCWGSVRRLDRATLAGQVAGFGVGALSGVSAVLGDFHWLTDTVGAVLLGSVVLTMGFAATREHVRRTFRPSRLEPP
jgi:membrane-associated phospholipid phosphatase